MRAGAREFSDWQWLPTVGFKRRGGGQVKYDSSGHILRVRASASRTYDLVFRNGEVKFYRPDIFSTAPAQTITGCPWTSIARDRAGDEGAR
jgi:hypothetical protein